MAFSNLSEKLQETFRRLRGKGKLGEKDVDEALRQVKLALLEADVNFRVVRSFVNRVSSFIQSANKKYLYTCIFSIPLLFE